MGLTRKGKERGDLKLNELMLRVMQYENYKCSGIYGSEVAFAMGFRNIPASK